MLKEKGGKEGRDPVNGQRRGDNCRIIMFTV